MDRKWTKVKDLKIGNSIAVYDDGNFAWDEIVSIKSVGRERVYDIEVENYHNFVGNGILAHNTYVFGNMGIGTTSPTHKLEVAGEAAALGFVNISTSEAKKDIEFLNEENENEILGKIVSTSVATYLYTNEECATDPRLSLSEDPRLSLEESGSCSKRMGLIAEQAPVEILSANKKGVDLYKMTSFLWGGLKSLSSQLEETKEKTADLDERLKELEKIVENMNVKDINALADNNNSDDANIISQGFDWVIERFGQIGVYISRGVIQAKEFVANKITAKKAVVDALEMKDSVTGEVYCVRISSGEWDKFKGTCGEVSSGQEPIPAPNTNTPVENNNIENSTENSSADNINNASNENNLNPESQIENSNQDQEPEVQEPVVNDTGTSASSTPITTDNSLETSVEALPTETSSAEIPIDETVNL